MATTTTTAVFHHIDPGNFKGKQWTKVDGPGKSFVHKPHTHPVTNLRGQEHLFNTDNAGFALFNYPAQEKLFTDDDAVRNGYYKEVEAVLRDKLPGVKKVVIFDHTIRRRIKDFPRGPVQNVHVDQSPKAAAVRVRRHIEDKEEAEELLKGRFQIINVWRPIGHPATDFPLGVIDWRSTVLADFHSVDLLYPIRDETEDDDDRGKEVVADPAKDQSTEGYEVKGETMAVQANDNQRFYYVKDMRPEEVFFLKCFDSWGEGMDQAHPGIAVRAPHSAFNDPDTPEDTPGRQSIEVRCLVFYE